MGLVSITSARVLRSALRLGSRAVNVLMDRSDPDLEGKLTEAVTGVQGVVGVDSVNVRTSGADSHADIVVQVERTSSVQEVDELRNRVASVARETGPILSVNVTPQGVADLSKPAAAAFAAANRLGIADQVHNVLAIDHPEGRWLMLHAKVDPVTSLGDAHELTDALERELRLEIADLARVEIHLEPREPEALSGEVVSTSETDLARRATKAALGHPPITGCHEVAVSAVEGRLHVVLHCDAPANVAIGEIHSAASDIERILHASDARVETVTIHFEPRRDERG